MRRALVVSEKLVNELGVILKEEFEIQLDSIHLTKLANFLVQYFGLLLKINNSNNYEKKT